MLDKINGKTISIINIVFVVLMNICLLLRFFLSPEGMDGVGGTPTFLFLIQFISTIAFSILIVLAELKKGETILGYLVIFRSRSGRGTVMLMCGLPVTNWHNWFIGLSAILISLVAVLNLLIGWSDEPLKLTNLSQDPSTA